MAKQAQLKRVLMSVLPRYVCRMARCHTGENDFMNPAAKRKGTIGKKGNLS